MRIDIITKEDNNTPSQTLFFKGKETDNPGELLLIDNKNKSVENFFREFSKGYIEQRIDEILTNRKYAYQIRQNELEIEAVLNRDKPIVEKIGQYICCKYKASYSMTNKRFRKFSLISINDFEQFETYFKQTLNSPDLFRTSLNLQNPSDEVLLCSLLREISINTMKERTYDADLYMGNQYPLDYNKLYILFYFLSYISPIVSKVLEFVPEVKKIGFPLKASIPIYFDGIANYTIKNLTLETPPTELMTIGGTDYTCLKMTSKCFEENKTPKKKMSYEETKDEISILNEQSKRKNSNVDFLLDEESKNNDDMSECAEGACNMKDFAEYCALEDKSLNRKSRHKGKLPFSKLGYCATSLVRRPKNNQAKPCINRGLTVFEKERDLNGSLKKNIEISMSNKSDFSPRSKHIGKIPLNEKDIVRLFRFSQMPKTKNYSNKIKDIDVDL